MPSYVRVMPPCLDDVYAWVPAMEPDAWRWFVEQYVNPVQRGEPRWPSFRRKFIEGTGTPKDDEAVAELMAVEAAPSVSIYLRGADHYQAMITVTREGAIVLGVSLDDPLGKRDIEDGRAVLSDLFASCGATAGMIGIELSPPRDLVEWNAADPLERRRDSRGVGRPLGELAVLAPQLLRCSDQSGGRTIEIAKGQNRQLFGQRQLHRIERARDAAKASLAGWFWVKGDVGHQPQTLTDLPAWSNSSQAARRPQTSQVPSGAPSGQYPTFHRSSRATEILANSHVHQRGSHMVAFTTAGR